jgi:hypothetical protein
MGLWPVATPEHQNRTRSKGDRSVCPGEVELDGYWEGKYVSMKVDRINVEFLEPHRAEQ